MINDEEGICLLRRFVEDQSQDAFSQLVHNYVDFVYSCALRLVGGDGQLAKDITQDVFIDLIRHACDLSKGTGVTGWLYVGTRYAAKKALRSQARWKLRQREGHRMQELTRQTEIDQVWSQIWPDLEESMNELRPEDRALVLARFFNGSSFGEIAKDYSLTENAARMRVDRALEKLRLRLSKRGIRSTAAMLAGTLATHAVGAAPPALAGAIARDSITGAALARSATKLNSEIFRYMTTRKLAVVAVGSALALATGTYIAIRYQLAAAESQAHQTLFESSQIMTLREQIRRLKADNIRLSTQSAAGSKIAGGPRLERLRLLTDLAKRGILNQQVQMVDRQGHLDPNFTDLFQLSPGEEALLQRSLDAARTQMAALSQANSKIVSQTDSRLVVQVAPFPQAGGQIYDALFSSVTSVLGSERNAAFSELSATGLEDEFDQFGAAQRAVTISLDPSSPDNPSQVVDRWTRTDETGTSVGTTSYALVDTGGLDRLGLGSIIPPAFQRVPATQPTNAPYDSVSSTLYTAPSVK